MDSVSGADPGFPVGGGANLPGEAPTYDFAKFCEKLHEIEKILGRRGGGVPGCPPKSGTEYILWIIFIYRKEYLVKIQSC